MDSLLPTSIVSWARTKTPQEPKETPIVSCLISTPDGVQIGTPGRQPAVFIDRDGVLNRFGKPKQPGQMTELLYPGAVDALVKLSEVAKLPIYIVSNQGNAGSDASTVMAMSELIEAVASQGGRISGVFYSPVKSDTPVCGNYVPATKPNAGLFYEAAISSGKSVDLADSYMIGDSVKDAKSARAADSRMTTVMVQTGNADQDELLETPPDNWAPSITEAVDWIIARESSLSSQEGTNE